MAKTKGGLDSGVSGKVGKAVYVQLYGKTVIRSLPQVKKDGRTPLQLLNQQRFKRVNDFCKLFKYTAIPQIWSPVAENMSGYPLFLKSNNPAFDKEGNLIDPALVKLSCGSLKLPSGLNARRKEGEPGVIELSWNQDSHITGLQRKDELMFISAGEGKYSDVMSTGILRGHLQGSFPLPVEPVNTSHLYLFFCSKDRRNYSESLCIEI